MKPWVHVVAIVLVIVALVAALLGVILTNPIEGISPIEFTAIAVVLLSVAILITAS